MSKIRFASYSFGCRVNHAERESIDKKMLSSGFVYDEKRPEIFIINTCAVTHKAEREVRQLIYKLKSQNSKIKIILAGCAATYWKKNKLYSYLPIDLLIDNINKEILVDLLIKKLFHSSNFNRRGWKQNGTTTQKLAIFDKFLNSGRLLIKIQNGCHRFCSYCIVPYLRGLPKSVKITDIVSEIKRFDKKIKEVILTAINTEAYGYDTQESFTDLVEAIIKQTKIPRISFGSIHPLSINNDFLDSYKRILPQERLVNFFHIPLQSGSNKILSLMKRGYSKENFIDYVQSIKRLNKNVFISTDIIVGFLEETATDFEETYNFLKKVPISKFHIFRFSKRKGTAGYFMSKRLYEPEEQIKQKRAKILAELNKKKFQTFLQKQIGLNSSALFLNKRIENYQEALLQNQIPAYIMTEKDLTSEIKNVKIKRIKEGKLFGNII